MAVLELVFVIKASSKAKSSFPAGDLAVETLHIAPLTDLGYRH